MKKTLISLAALSLLSGAASAQSNVAIYGIVDAGIAREDNGVAHTTRLDSGTHSGSRLGFRAVEDLGGGLSAIAIIENGFATDTGNATQGGLVFGRETSVGLKGSFGLVKAGRFKTPIYLALDNLDPLRVGLGGGADRLFYNGTIVIRADNTVRYETPDLSGLVGSAAYSFGEAAGDTGANRQYGLGLDYLKGPVDVRFAYHNRNIAAPVDTDIDTWVLGGIYNFGIAKLHVVFGGNDSDPVVGASTKTRDALFGITVPVGPHKFFVTYVRNEVRHVNDADSDQFALAYNYNLSKRTNLYATYSRLENDGGAKLKTVGNGQTNTLATFGIRHLF